LKLTVKQLKSLPDHLPSVLESKDYFNSLFAKDFGLKLAEYSKKSNEQTSPTDLVIKRELISNLRKILKQYDLRLLDSFSDQLLLEGLHIDLLLKRPQMEDFEEYLKRPHDTTNCFSKKYEKELDET